MTKDEESDIHYRNI